VSNQIGLRHARHVRSLPTMHNPFRYFNSSPEVRLKVMIYVTTLACATGFVAKAARPGARVPPRAIGDRRRSLKILQATPTAACVVHKPLKTRRRGFDDRTSPSANYQWW
jgi:hypothetical protein